MTENIDIVKEAISEHEIKQDVPLAAESITDVEALFLLNRAYSGWTQSTDRDFPDRHEQLVQTLADVERGLRRHWDNEEKTLPKLLGQPLMKALILEHVEIAGQLQAAKGALSGAGLEGLGPSEVLARKTGLQSPVNRVIQSIEEHNRHEEIIFKMLKKALESGSA